MRKFTAILFVIGIVTLPCHGELRGKLVPEVNDVVVSEIDTTRADTIGASGLPQFQDDAVTIKGFNKRVADNYETFFAHNNTAMHITGLTVTLRYMTMDGNVLHERTQHVQCDLPPGKSRQVSIYSFDRQHVFYYYLSGKPRNSATPFKVAVRLMAYDVSIRRQ